MSTVWFGSDGRGGGGSLAEMLSQNGLWKARKPSGSGREPWYNGYGHACIYYTTLPTWVEWFSTFSIFEIYTFLLIRYIFRNSKSNFGRARSKDLIFFNRKGLKKIKNNIFYPTTIWHNIECVAFFSKSIHPTAHHHLLFCLRSHGWSVFLPFTTKRDTATRCSTCFILYALTVPYRAKLRYVII